MTLAADLLERHRPKPGDTDLRAFEWHYLRRLQHRDLRTVNAHFGWATTVAWTPDGKKLVSVGTSGRETGIGAPSNIKLWDAATLTPLSLRLDGSTGNISTRALSPDGHLLAAGCRDKRIRLWNIATGALFATLEGHKGDLIRQVVFSPTASTWRLVQST